MTLRDPVPVEDLKAVIDAQGAAQLKIDPIVWNSPDMPWVGNKWVDNTNGMRE